MSPSSAAVAPPPTLVLLPGLDGSGLLFGPLLAALPPTLPTRVIAYPAARLQSLEEHAQWVAERLPEGPLVLLAESFSGLVALSLLQGGADARIRGVAFCATFARPPRPWLLGLARRLPWLGRLVPRLPAALLRQFCLGGDADEVALGALRAALAAVTPQVAMHRLGIVGTPRQFADLPAQLPVLYLQGRADRLVPAAAADWFRTRWPALALHPVDGPHFLLQSRPAACAAILSRWLERLAAAG